MRSAGSPAVLEYRRCLAVQRLVEGYYEHFLNRQGDAAGLSFYVGLLQNGSRGLQPIFVSDPSGQVHHFRDEDIIIFIVSSAEYFIRFE